MNKFKTLLQRYQDQTASAEEKAELFSLIRTGEYDDILENDLLELMEREFSLPASSKEKEILDRLYNEKLKERIEADRAEVRVVKVIRLRDWLTAAAIISGIVFGVWWFSKDRLDRQPLSARNETRDIPAIDVHLVKFTDKQLVHLPDGSSVLLNNGSELTYNQQDFGKNGREVTLSGEAFFDIEHDLSRPFKVHTGKIITTVLGTAFNVSALPDKQQVRITVARGRVKVGDKSRTYDMITPDEEMIVNTSTNDFVKQNVNAKLVTKWKDQFLILDNITMQQALTLISDRFNVKLILNNSKLSNCHISASFFNGENLEHVLNVIGVVNQITYSFNPDGSVTLDGGALCK